MPQIVCPHCEAINRLPETALLDKSRAQAANCGKCKHPLFTAEPLAVNQSQFERQLQKSDVPLVVDFWAAWCGPCKMMAPVFHQAAGKLEPQVRLLKVDTESEQQLAARYAVRSIPTIMIFSAGQEKARIAGALDLNRLLAWVTQNLR
ncbi:MAG TPA: thioredoxin TrxC [Gammaproteobacteria bacterium]|nr:thioredoxin TrxC [Gammaproteobacteria bacterium]